MKNQRFYVKDFCYIKSENEIDVSFIPPIQRRKLSKLDKMTLTVMSKIYSDEIEEIVFASRYGESDRLNAIISEYKEFEEVSPTQFSASVHNYPVGFFTLIKKLNIPYYALSAGEETFYAGLIKSIISKKNVLFVYSDKISIACIISQNTGKELKLKNYKVEEFIAELGAKP